MLLTNDTGRYYMNVHNNYSISVLKEWVGYVWRHVKEEYKYFITAVCITVTSNSGMLTATNVFREQGRNT